MKAKITFIYFVFVVIFCQGCACLSETGMRYREGVGEISENRSYFAILKFRDIVKEDPHSPYAPSAMFALGEYYFDQADYFSALTTFSDYIQNYPKDKGVVFAKLIIYKIVAEFKKEEALGIPEEALIKEIRKQLFSQPLFLIFYDKKAPRSYKSLFHNSYVVYDYVDKIKVFRNDKIFLELSP